MSRQMGLTGVVLALIAAAAATLMWQHSRARQTRELLYEALAPVALANCEMERYGDRNDGGYLLCRNLLSDVRAAYSYGINATDEWGCEVSREFSVPVHQYDCFNTDVPACSGGDTHFNAVCVGPESTVIDGRPFETVSRQVAKNGDADKRLVVKMDVEGAEWSSLLAAPDSTLDQIDQLAVEFHGVEKPELLDTVQRLKQFFYVVNVHQNNFGCEPGLDPFPGSIYEVLFVNKRLAQVAQERPTIRHHALDAPNAAWLPDCQTLTPSTASSDFALFRRWVRRELRERFYGSPFDGV